MSITSLTTTRATTLPIVLLMLIVGLTVDVAAKRKDDVLVLDNGDRVVGEVKKLERGQLHFKPAWVLNTFQVDWTKVRTLESQDEYRLLLSNGRRFTGTIARDPSGQLTVGADGGHTAAVVNSTDIVGFLPVEISLWAQLTGQINSGFTYNGGDTTSQFSASGSVGYVADRYTFDLAGSSTISGNTDGTTTARNTAQQVNFIALWPNWFAAALIDFLNSEQQGLDLRTTTGGAIGRYLVRTERTELAAIGGMVYTREQYDSTSVASTSPNNLEGLLSLTFSLYRFKTTDVRSALTAYPSITTPGRVRLNYAPSLNLEIARNLYWSFTLYENYDSKPPVNANKNDFGLTNTIGWKF